MLDTTTVSFSVPRINSRYFLKDGVAVLNTCKFNGNASAKLLYVTSNSSLQSLLVLTTCLCTYFENVLFVPNEVFLWNFIALFRKNLQLKHTEFLLLHVVRMLCQMKRVETGLVA